MAMTNSDTIRFAPGYLSTCICDSLYRLDENLFDYCPTCIAQQVTHGAQYAEALAIFERNISPDANGLDVARDTFWAACELVLGRPVVAGELYSDHLRLAYANLRNGF